MAFIATDTGGNSSFKRVPPGVYIGRCYNLVDLGTQFTDGQYGPKSQHKIKLGWELFGEDENGQPLTMDINGIQLPMTVSKTYTVSLHEKAKLRLDLAAWRGKDFTEEEAKAFDVSKLVGAYCMVNVTHSETNGKTFTNIAGLTPIPGALKNSKPEPIHKNVMFDLDNPDMNVFNTFHEKLQEAIKKSPEWAKATGTKPVAGSGFDDMSDAPF